MVRNPLASTWCYMDTPYFSLTPKRAFLLALLLLTATLPTREMLVRNLGFLSLASIALSSPISYPGIPATLDLLSAHLSEVIEHLDNHTVSSEALVNAYLARIDANNHKGLLLRAVIETAPRESSGGVVGVLDIAREYDEERKHGKLRGRLHGVPILVKVPIL